MLSFKCPGRFELLSFGTFLNFHAWMFHPLTPCDRREAEHTNHCDLFYLNSFCLHLPISFMNMEGVRSAPVFICGLFLTQNASCWCSENPNERVTPYRLRHTFPCGETTRHWILTACLPASANRKTTFHVSKFLQLENKCSLTGKKSEENFWKTK